MEKRNWSGLKAAWVADKYCTARTTLSPWPQADSSQYLLRTCRGQTKNHRALGLPHGVGKCEDPKVGLKKATGCPLHQNLESSTKTRESAQNARLDRSF
jgi:hypothetical protein